MGHSWEKKVVRKQEEKAEKAHREKGCLLEPVGAEMPKAGTRKVSKSGRPLEISQQNHSHLCSRVRYEVAGPGQVKLAGRCISQCWGR